VAIGEYLVRVVMEVVEPAQNNDTRDTHAEPGQGESGKPRRVWIVRSRQVVKVAQSRVARASRPSAVAGPCCTRMSPAYAR